MRWWSEPAAGPRRPGALQVVALILFLSGLARIAAGSSHALAGTAETEASLATPPDQGLCTTEEGTLALFESLREREKRLTERENALAAQDRAAASAKAEIDRRLADLASAEEKLSATIALAENAAEDDVSKLVSVYESMKPKDAAPLFAAMSPEFAAGFISRMRPDSAAAVMAGLNPELAYAISIVLAGRNAGAPTE